MSLEGLRCKECGTEYPLEALFVCDQCFGPLEVAYDHSRLDAEETEAAASRPARRDLALRRLPAVRESPRAARSSRA